MNGVNIWFILNAFKNDVLCNKVWKMGGRKDVWLLASSRMHRWHSSGWMPPVLLACAFTDASQSPLGHSAHLQEVRGIHHLIRSHGRQSIYKGLAEPRIFLGSRSFSALLALDFNLPWLLVFVPGSVCPGVHPSSRQAPPLVPVWLRFRTWSEKEFCVIR